MPDLSAKGQAALEWVALGFKIYPTCPNTKIPLKGSHGRHDATDDPAKIYSWWMETPDANIAFCPGDNGMCVIDLDPLAVSKRDSFPKTFTVLTPGVGKATRGYHLYFKGRLPLTRGKLGEDIETLGDRAQVMLPPSSIEGIEYEVVDGQDAVDIPDDIKARIAKVDISRGEAPERELDAHDSLASGRNYLADELGRAAEGIRDGGRNNRCYEVAAYLFDFGLSRDTVQELMEGFNEQACVPPLSSRDLGTLVASAGVNRQNEVGSKAASAPPEQLYADAPIVAQLIAEAPKPAPSRWLSAADLLGLPDPQELVPMFLMQNENVAIYGLPKVGKTYIMLDAALSIAAKVPVFGELVPTRFSSVLYFSGEGHAGMKRRLKAWAQDRGIDLATIPFYYHMGVPFAADYKATVEAVMKSIPSTVKDKPALIVIDTMARAMTGLNENDAGDVNKYLEMTEHLRQAFPGSTVVSLAHSGKDGTMGIRGSNNTVAGLDAVWEATMNDRKQIKLDPRWMKDADDMAPIYLQFNRVLVDGMKLNRGSVLRKITEEDYKSKDEDNTFDAQLVIRPTLERMKALGRAKGVSTIILAETICARVAGEDDEGHKSRITSARKRLSKLAKTLLSPYAERKENGELIWYLPVTVA